MNNPDYLEDICGISQLIRQIDLNNIEYDDANDDF